MARRIRLNHLTLATLVDELLSTLPVSEAELVEATGLFPDTVHDYMQSMHKRGVVRIMGWTRAANHRWMPNYILGRGADVPKPAALTATEKSRLRRKGERAARAASAISTAVTTKMLKSKYGDHLRLLPSVPCTGCGTAGMLRVTEKRGPRRRWECRACLHRFTTVDPAPQDAAHA